MSIVLDTNIFVRIITDDDPVRAAKAKKLIDTETELFVPESVFPEIEYFLKKVEKRTHTDIAKVFTIIAAYKNISLDKETRIAISIYKNHTLDMADCLIAAHAVGGKLASFDDKLLKIEGMKSYW